MNLEFEISNQILKRTDTENVVSESKNIYKCIFTFEDDDWQPVNKFAIFKDGWGNSTTVHLGKNSVKLSCIIPNNVLRGNHFKVTVYGGDLLTTNNVTVPLIESGYTRNHHYGCSKEHKDIFVEIFDRLDANISNIAFGDNCLHIFNNEELIESIYLPYADEDLVRGVMQEFREEFKDTIDEKLDNTIEEILCHLEDYVKKDEIVLTDDGVLVFY